MINIKVSSDMKIVPTLVIFCSVIIILPLDHKIAIGASHSQKRTDELLHAFMHSLSFFN